MATLGLFLFDGDSVHPSLGSDPDDIAILIGIDRFGGAGEDEAGVASVGGEPSHTEIVAAGAEA